MPAIRKRGRVSLAEDDDDVISPPPPPRTQRRRDSDASDFGDATQADGNMTSHQQMIKNLVRLALASEYSRTPLRRADISAKVLGTQSRQFRAVFDGAQLALRQTFGMELVELPRKENLTLAQRRAAQKSQGPAGSNSWILRSLLPERFHAPEILVPPKVPTEEMESAYVGLYTFLVAVIMLSGGSLPEAKMDRYLKRTNAEHSTPVDKTDKLFARMIKEGYIVRNKESVDGEEVVEYYVGPRGKMEVGKQGTAGLVKAVYGEQEDEELERRLERSLKVYETTAVRNEQQDALADGSGAPRKRRGRPRRSPRPEDEESDGND